MTKKDSQAPSALVAAAEAVDVELRSFEELTTALKDIPLHNEKNLERAGRTLHNIAACEERLGTRVQELVAAVGEARTRQQAQAEEVQQAAATLQARTEELKTLLERMRGLGAAAADLSGKLAQAVGGGDHGDGDGKPVEREPMLAQVGPLLARLRELVKEAEDVKQEAEGRGFIDLTRQADAMRQQLGAVHAKLAATPPSGAG